MKERMMSLALFALLVCAAATAAFADPASRPTTGPANGWTPDAFTYDKPAALAVEESTPTRTQVDWTGQPPKLAENLPAPTGTGAAAEPYVYEGLNLVRLRFRDLSGADVPVLLCTPKDKKGPFPVVVAVHGLGSHKAQVIAQVAPSLVKRGFAVLAPDMPLHGERPGNGRKMFDQADLPGLVARVRQAVMDTRLCIDLAEQRPDLDTSRGVVLVGYSMGAIIDSVVGPADPRVKAMCLMVGGTVELPPAAAFIPQLMALSPQMAIPHFARPLLMVNARRDHIITAEMTERLYRAASDPKKQVWYDSGHLLPAKAYEEAAEWVAQTWKAVSTTAE